MMKQLSLAQLLRRLSQSFVLPDRDRSRPAMTAEALESRRRDINRSMITRIVLNFTLLLLLANLRSDIDHVEALQQLLLICATVTCILACLCRERPSLTVLNRWDEAAIFLTVALGLRTFA